MVDNPGSTHKYVTGSKEGEEEDSVVSKSVMFEEQVLLRMAR
jgi:hypothetical protein